MTQARHPERLRAFIGALAELIDSNPREGDLLHRGGKLLAQLVSHDDWLPEDFARPDPERYQQYLLHADSRQRFSIVSFVWGPGQRTPIHDHRVWGLIGMLRGSEYSQGFARHSDGSLQAEGNRIQLLPGQVEAVSPKIGDIHSVSNAFDDQVSISIHVYGANIGAVRRAVYQCDGSEKLFISGYSNAFLPNIWDLSKESQAL
ncbi:cysteine dioxygenase [Pseudomonas chlororaphis]|uniref:cysteine dioxygenase family protein n=1 Tax=Pseudomonas chlororaphis TaxID=587753 RepID=UPI0006A5B9B8|nr:cysteine dioxygenase [Pseudomonas chlororaphis]AZC31174.1 Cysteine dioxygenase [Pseudomonas chlororaphis subsp. piscium]WDG78174.1 cysteine dioxygenase [Pseudomonas chlororaphis]WDG82591.1 cysteine dioxygenase [Pseudomonas chlororaphis]WDG88976.1 cysteine dioxygenase [Pseudomonas chlororaphis]SDS98923.1 Predicted metal-dependent enzyme of the double-stranded beta helix superfamily [Pseudomonas chlororaphis]